jgi:hypothetical protein
VRCIVAAQADANAATLHRLLAPGGAGPPGCAGPDSDSEEAGPGFKFRLEDFDPMAAAGADAAAEFAADWALGAPGHEPHDSDAGG